MLLRRDMALLVFIVLYGYWWINPPRVLWDWAGVTVCNLGKGRDRTPIRCPQQLGSEGQGRTEARTGLLEWAVHHTQITQSLGLALSSENSGLGAQAPHCLRQHRECVFKSNIYQSTHIDFLFILSTECSCFWRACVVWKMYHLFVSMYNSWRPFHSRSVVQSQQCVRY